MRRIDQLLAMFNHGYSKRAVMAFDITGLLGATLVIGEPENIEKLTEVGLPPTEPRRKDAQAVKNQGLLPSIVDWLFRGERGLSSDAMCAAFYGLPKKQSCCSSS